VATQTSQNSPQKTLCRPVFAFDGVAELSLSIFFDPAVPSVSPDAVEGRIPRGPSNMALSTVGRTSSRQGPWGCRGFWCLGGSFLFSFFITPPATSFRLFFEVLITRLFSLEWSNSCCRLAPPVLFSRFRFFFCRDSPVLFLGWLLRCAAPFDVVLWTAPMNPVGFFMGPV